MNRTAFLLSAGAGLFLASAVGCSSTSGGSTGGSSTTTTHMGGSTTTSHTTSSTTTTAPTLDCTSYCTSITAACTGAQAQYFAVGSDNGLASCMGACAGFTAKGTLADMAGDTLGCRIYHAGAASANAAAAVTHCQHAGPTGGDKDPKGTTGTCGEPCTSFCSIATAVCTGTNKQFADMPTCITACQAFKVDANSYSTADTATNDMGCRFYHLSAAASSTANAVTHCPHIVPNSSVCIM